MIPSEFTNGMIKIQIDQIHDLIGKINFEQKRYYDLDRQFAKLYALHLKLVSRLSLGTMPVNEALKEAQEALAKCEPAQALHETSHGTK